MGAESAGMGAEDIACQILGRHKMDLWALVAYELFVGSIGSSGGNQPPPSTPAYTHIVVQSVTYDKRWWFTGKNLETNAMWHGYTDCPIVAGEHLVANSDGEIVGEDD
jgi:hypothetical protein